MTSFLFMASAPVCGLLFGWATAETLKPRPRPAVIYGGFGLAAVIAVLAWTFLR